jgi:probable S-adenosylmethionine-dependent methyltransferase, YraL family
MENDQPLEPGLYLVGTPIGNMEDITLRALRILSRVDALACEDTRVTRKLFSRHSLPAPKMLFVANEHTESKVSEKMILLAQSGKSVAFCSDAGMPGISDPGYRLAEAARSAGVRVEVIPGVSAVTTAAALSGVVAGSFTFLGFPSRREGRVRLLLRSHGALPAAMILYESPRRLGKLLAFAADELGGARQAAVCLELTKKFERVARGGLAKLAELYAGEPPKGEATVVISGAAGAAPADAGDADGGTDGGFGDFS